MRRKILFFLIFVVPLFELQSQIPQNPRAMAEFEELDGLLLCWREDVFLNEFNSVENTGGWSNSSWNYYQGMLNPMLTIVEEALDEGLNVYIMDDTSSTRQSYFPNIHPKFYDVHDTLASYGISSDNLHFIYYDGADYPASVWTRDWGPFSVYENYSESLFLIGRPFNKVIADYLDIPIMSIDKLIHGGDYITDGFGNLFYDGLWEKSWEMPTEETFGIDNSVEVGGYRVHIDYYMKMINEETIFVSSIPRSNYNQFFETDFQDSLKIESAISVLENMVSCYGRPFKIVRINNAPTSINSESKYSFHTNDASYVNSLIINKKVLVPTFDNIETDSVALNIYKRHMPGYEIVGIPMPYYAGQGGEVHCITKEVGASEPIVISHAWYPDSVNQITDYTISADIRTASGISNSNIYWTTDPDNGFQIEPMSYNGENQFTGVIPGQVYGKEIHYYIEVTANSGKTGVKPLVSPEGAYRFLVDPNGVVTGVNSPTKNKPILAQNYSLEQNYPNPFNSSTMIKVSIPETDHVKVFVYSISGQLITELLDQVLPRGELLLSWDGRNSSGKPVSSGIYILRMETPHFTNNIKMSLVK